MQISKGVILLSFILFQQTVCLAQNLTIEQKDSILSVLEIMHEDDQKYRWQLAYNELDSIKIDSIKKTPGVSKWSEGKTKLSDVVRDSLWNLQYNLDSINKGKFILLIKKYGYPSYQRVGSTIPELILVHFVGVMYSPDLIPLFKEQVFKGNMRPGSYALWYDKCQMMMHKKPLYGELDKKYPCVEDLKQTNKERKKIGLPKIKENKCRQQ